MRNSSTNSDAGRRSRREPALRRQPITLPTSSAIVHATRVSASDQPAPVSSHSP